jgi:hypothetical protein
MPAVLDHLDVEVETTDQVGAATHAWPMWA